jgi:RNA polymerase sigma-70 factor (ECF subfamily)
MQPSSIHLVLSRFNSMPADVWDYRDDIENLARLLCGNPEDAEDVAHAALVTAAEQLDSFRGEASVRTWLHTIATNECRSLRGRTAAGAIDGYLDEALDGELISPAPDPESLAIELESRKEVIDALAALPDNYRCALLLKEGQGLTVRQTASIMGTSPASVRSVLYRARQSLRGRLSA